MDKLRRYILSNLSILFFSIFLPLFAIASVIFMIKLATYTAVIQLSIMEMAKLYLFVLPELLFYTLPIAFFVSGALALFRLSNDNEMVVVFSLGISPTFIAKTLAFPAFLLTLFLYINYLVITPYINIVNEAFIKSKQSEAKFNLTASEYGQSFGNWMIFINKSDNKNSIFSDVVLFNKEAKEEMLITAKEAKLLNNHGFIQLKLTNGQGYIFNDESLKLMNYKTLKINDTFEKGSTLYNGIIDYWTNDVRHERKQKLLITNALLSLFPLLSIFLIVALGIVHSRHQKRWIYLWLFLTIVSFYSGSILIQKWLGYWTVPVVIFFWLIVTYGFYRQQVGKRF